MKYEIHRWKRVPVPGRSITAWDFDIMLDTIYDTLEEAEDVIHDLIVNNDSEDYTWHIFETHIK